MNINLLKKDNEVFISNEEGILRTVENRENIEEIAETENVIEEIKKQISAIEDEIKQFIESKSTNKKLMWSFLILLPIFFNFAISFAFVLSGIITRTFNLDFLFKLINTNWFLLPLTTSINFILHSYNLNNKIIAAEAKKAFLEEELVKETARLESLNANEIGDVETKSEVIIISNSKVDKLNSRLKSIELYNLMPKKCLRLQKKGILNKRLINWHDCNSEEADMVQEIVVNNKELVKIR